MRNFSHSGDLGDIIYSLPTIRACGGGNLTLFHFPGRTAHGMSPEKVSRIAPLLERQPYIGKVEWTNGFMDHSLNGFRDHLGACGNLADAHLATHGYGWQHRIEPWLEVDVPRIDYPVVFARSFRYRNYNFPWGAIADKYRGQAGFLGFPDEHKDFCRCFGDLPLIEADNFLEVARVIAGCKLFVGNQSSPLAVAYGLKHRLIMEISPGESQHHCVFQRMNAIIGWDAKIELPDFQAL